jgi:sugar phosphate isomerase/epimerase
MIESFAERLGIFARTFRATTPAEVAEAVSKAGYRLAHWNFAAIGRDTLGPITAADCIAVHDAFAARAIRIPSASATFNAIHPHITRRQRDVAAAVKLIELAPHLGADVVTLCTGTRDPDLMWRHHPANRDPAAWRDLRASLDLMLAAASSAGVRLGVEPEAGNVINDASAAARLLHELGDDAPLGIVLDPANLLDNTSVAEQDAVIGRAIDLLGHRVIGTQAKDVPRMEGGSTAAGDGLLDYPRVLAQLQRLAPVPLIVQDVTADNAATVRARLISWQRQAARQGE